MLTTVGLLVTQAVGSLFNVWYNLTHIRPLLSDTELASFMGSITVFNAIVYPIASAIWVWVMCSLARAYESPTRLLRARQRAINLPWWVIGIGLPSWLLSIPALLWGLHRSSPTIDPQVDVHLPVSVLIASLIALAHGFFVVELIAQRLWYPVLFRDAAPTAVRGTLPLTLRRRGVMWAVSAVACPILSLLLIIVVPPPGGVHRVAFPLSVGALGVLFGFASAWFLGRIVIHPVDVLRDAARGVAAGDLDVEIDLPRADEFGTLIEQFNHMVADLREKRRSDQIFGRHVGFEVARVLLERGEEELEGVERDVTVVFVDIRNFTPRCARSGPREVVSMLNIFFNFMVDTVEGCHGIVNQFTGDGFMAVFGATGTPESARHADDALACGRQMLAELDAINGALAAAGLDPIEIGVGINTGPAVIGSIGADRRSSYTAIGDAVNVSARIEAHTKACGQTLLFSESTLRALAEPVAAVELPPASLKGKARPLQLYHLAEE